MHQFVAQAFKNARGALQTLRLDPQLEVPDVTLDHGEVVVLGAGVEAEPEAEAI